MLHFQVTLLAFVGAAMAAGDYFGLIQCPDTRIEMCKMMNSLDERGNRNMCTGMACPPCWAFHDGVWECTEKFRGKCLDRAAVDILSLPNGCYTRVVPAPVLDINNLQ